MSNVFQAFAHSAAALLISSLLSPALLTETACAAPAQHARNAPAAGTGYFQEISPVARSVWVLAEPKFQLQPIGNVTVIEQSDGLVLVDSGGSAGAGRRIVAMVRRLSHKPVKAIFISEWHGDKAQGLGELLKAWPGARTIATLQTQAHLADPRTMNTPAVVDPARNARFVQAQRDIAADLEGAAGHARTDTERRGFAAASRAFAQYARDVDGTVTLAPTEGFADQLTIADARTPVEAMFLGNANTDGDAVIWLPRQRILVTGETVIAPFPYGFESYPAIWINVLARMRALPFRTLIPGHGPPEHDRAQMDRITVTLRSVQAQVGRLVAQGLTLPQVQARVDLSTERESFVGDDPWLGRWFKSFWTDPIVASAYKEAKGQPIVQNLSG